MVLEAPYRLADCALPALTIGADGVLVQVVACGLCGTDHEQYAGALAGGFAFGPGHETGGVIEAIGPRVVRRSRVAAGDLVAVEVFQSCRTCPACRTGEYRRCEQHGLSDMYGFIPVTRAPVRWGGYAEYPYLAPDSMLLLPVPAELDPVLARLFNPLSAGIRWAATVPGTAPGDVAAVLGPGIRGLCAAVAASEAGAGFVMVSGLGPRDADRLALAWECGADLAVDVTAKAPAAFAQAIALARPAGTVVVAGTRGFGSGAPGFSPDAVVAEELRVLGALGVDATAYRAALDLLAAGRYPVANLPHRCVGFDDVEDLPATMAGERDDIPPAHGVLTP